MDGVTLADLEARRAALDDEIRRVKQAERQAWNDGIDQCESDLSDWLGEHAIEVTSRERKNEATWNIGHDALVVTFAVDDGEHGGGLRAVSGRTLTLEWSEVPTPARFLAIVAALLNVGTRADGHEGEEPAAGSGDDRDYPDGNGNDARLKRWLVDNGTDPRIREQAANRVTLAGGAVYDLLSDVMSVFYRHGIDDMRGGRGVL